MFHHVLHYTLSNLHYLHCGQRSFPYHSYIYIYTYTYAWPWHNDLMPQESYGSIWHHEVDRWAMLWGPVQRWPRRLVGVVESMAPMADGAIDARQEAWRRQAFLAWWTILHRWETGGKRRMPTQKKCLFLLLNFRCSMISMVCYGFLCVSSCFRKVPTFPPRSVGQWPTAWSWGSSYRQRSGFSGHPMSPGHGRSRVIRSCCCWLLIFRSLRSGYDMLWHVW